MNFNPNTSNQALKDIFSHKVKIIAHPQLVVNNNAAHKTATQKYLGMFVNLKLDFPEHFEVNKLIKLLDYHQNNKILFLDHKY